MPPIQVDVMRDRTDLAGACAFLTVAGVVESVWRLWRGGRDEHGTVCPADRVPRMGRPGQQAEGQDVTVRGLCQQPHIGRLGLPHGPSGEKVAVVTVDDCDTTMAVRFGNYAGNYSCAAQGTQSGSKKSLDLTGPLLLGGVPNLPEDFPVHNRQFVGCMRNLSIDGKVMDMAGFIANNGTRAELAPWCPATCLAGGDQSLSSPKMRSWGLWVLQFKVAEKLPLQRPADKLARRLECTQAPGVFTVSPDGCAAQRNFCDGAWCQNGGTCLNRWNMYVCACPLRFGGRNCEQVMPHPQHFSGESIVFWGDLAITISVPWYLGLMFRTRRVDGVLMEATAGGSSRLLLQLLKHFRVEVIILGNYLRFEVSHGPTDVASVLLSRSRVTDGEWHHLLIELKSAKEGKDIKYLAVMTLDYGMDQGTVQIGNQLPGLRMRSVTVGGVSEDKVSVRRGFRGCMQGVRMGETSTNIATLNMDDALKVRVKDGCELEDACASSPCPPHSRCRDVWDSYACVCDRGYFGQRCVDACHLNPCEHVATCVHVPSSPRGYACKCGPGHYGQHCENRVDLPCPKGWWGSPVCGPCHCAVSKGFDPDCNKTSGQCQCKENHYKPPDQDACLPCDCFPHGAHSRTCDMDTGQCACKPGVIGRQCNRCDNPFAEVTTLGCEVIYSGCPKAFEAGIWWPQTKFGQPAAVPCPKGSVAQAAAGVSVGSRAVTTGHVAAWHAEAERRPSVGQDVVSVGSALLAPATRPTWEQIQRNEGGSAQLLRHFEAYFSTVARNLRTTYLRPFIIVTPNMILAVDVFNKSNFTGARVPRFEDIQEEYPKELGSSVLFPADFFKSPDRKKEGPTARPPSQKAFPRPAQPGPGTDREASARRQRRHPDEPSQFAVALVVIYRTLGQLLPEHYDPDRRSLRLPSRPVINTAVVSAAVYSEGTGLPSPLERPILVELALLETEERTKPACVLWNHSIPTGGTGGWSARGCELLSRNRTHITCQCSHLHSFAVLMDVSRRESNLHNIHKHLAVALFCSQLVFGVGINQTENPFVCTVIAILLHYVHMSTFAWTFVEGLHVYRMLTEARNIDMGPMHFYYVVGWGVPAVITGLAVGLDPQGYGNPDFCWLSLRDTLIWSFAGPIGAVIVINTVIFVLSAKVSCQRKRHYYERKGVISLLRTAFLLLLLVGATWLLGLLAVNHDSLAFHYLFAVFSGLQGLFVLSFHCVFNREVRKHLKGVLAGKKPHPDDSAATRATLLTRSLNCNNTYNEEPNMYRTALGESTASLDSTLRGEGVQKAGVSSGPVRGGHGQPDVPFAHGTTKKTHGRDSDSDSELSLDEQSSSYASSHSSDSEDEGMDPEQQWDPATPQVHTRGPVHSTPKVDAEANHIEANWPDGSLAGSDGEEPAEKPRLRVETKVSVELHPEQLVGPLPNPPPEQRKGILKKKVTYPPPLTERSLKARLREKLADGDQSAGSSRTSSLGSSDGGPRVPADCGVTVKSPLPREPVREHLNGVAMHVRAGSAQATGADSESSSQQGRHQADACWGSGARGRGGQGPRTHVGAQPLGGSRTRPLPRHHLPEAPAMTGEGVDAFGFVLDAEKAKTVLRLCPDQGAHGTSNVQSGTGISRSVLVETQADPKTGCPSTRMKRDLRASS
ncbi:cadherin EGF LAG seven-pass G-type receptor 1 [Orycteropus afer afer]|uniref:Cadherin EGF LAG seven-pass G-type receptor 1 n=1 Tax=Orycteropus afer afer TaxID=1230840 RepID=A0AC54ZB69_ORYAF|nr:cadherin EGF LAG seven-pass G-type receptor 1 [Orycteropus afer afer]